MGVRNGIFLRFLRVWAQAPQGGPQDPPDPSKVQILSKWMPESCFLLCFNGSFLILSVWCSRYLYTRRGRQTRGKNLVGISHGISHGYPMGYRMGYPKGYPMGYPMEPNKRSSDSNTEHRTRTPNSPNSVQSQPCLAVAALDVPCLYVHPHRRCGNSDSVLPW